VAVIGMMYDKMESIMRQHLLIVLCTLGLVLSGCSEPMPKGYQPLPQSIKITGMNLYDQNGQTIHEQNLQDHWSLVFFGYTYCPDVCPTTLAELNRVASKVTSKKLQVALVSVDPERDTPAQLKSYIEYFNPKFQAWSGDIINIEMLARQMHIFFQKQPHGDSYLMDHSSQVVLVNPQGEYEGFFTAPLNVEEMSDYLNSRM
jgi:protein SCO1/2